MSTYVDKAVNPKTGKFQAAWFIDDYYGSHAYGVGFRNDGKDAVFNEKIEISDYSIYPLASVELQTKAPHSDKQESDDTLETNNDRN